MDPHTSICDGKPSGVIDWPKTIPGASPLHHYAIDGDCRRMMNMLLAGDIAVDVQSDNAVTPLYLAVEHTQVEAVCLLLASKASPDVSGPINCMTPLMIAACRKTSENQFILQLLLKSGAKLNTQNRYERTALVVAVRAENLDSVKTLCEAGADVNIPDNTGCTAVFKALFRGNIELLKVLKEYGADFDRPIRSGQVPLITAIEEDLHEVVKYLIESNASLEVKNDEGDTALHVAVWHENTDFVRMLCEAGANINTLDKEEKTPLDNALFKQHVQITMTLISFNAEVSSGSFEETMLQRTSVCEDFQTTMLTFMQTQERHRASQHEHMSRIQAIADEMTCSICLHVVTMPTTVSPCQHSFCAGCVQKLHKCPTCRCAITGRNGNYMLTNVSTVFSNGEPPAKRARAP